MSLPRPAPVTSRLNVGGYGVTILGEWHVSEALRFTPFRPAGRRIGELRMKRTSGTVTPDGTLTLTPEAWAVRHYRRAVMGGAGVYRLGLWAFLAARRAPRAPAPALKVENGAEQLAALRRAAHEKVRPSVRWKTGARRRRFRKLEALDRVAWAAHLIRRQVEGRRGLTAWGDPRTRRRKREEAREAARELREDRLRMLAPSVEAVEVNGKSYAANGIDLQRVQFLESMARSLAKSGPTIRRLRFPIFVAGFEEGRLLGQVMAYANLCGLKGTVSALIANIHARRWQVSLALTLARRALEAAAYRAHLARRVRPVSRRTRAPRPLYARPRPPTAPLAPPALA
ncbi:hypothetical protein [Deinococcus murrayi]|uniref:hypothetical protein n=1 Tax=Deinococcus murrayi TaxID=68910 RepID=UPI000551DDDF|nr:hypothetical protein [Deinococcus murrayi]